MFCVEMCGCAMLCNEKREWAKVAVVASNAAIAPFLQ